MKGRNKLKHNATDIFGELRMTTIKKLKLHRVKGKKAYRFLTRSDDEVYIGDPEEKKATFKPQLLLKRWLDECFIKLPIGNIAKQLTFDEENNCLIWEGEWFTVKVYPIDKTEVKATINEKEHVFIQNEHGGLEFEAVLKTKPPVNSFSFSIETKGLKFYYQPPLHPDHPTWADTDGDGVADTFRPENVVGSYAVYHATRTNIHRSKADAEKYKAGKAFHIYRPKAIDSAGNETWCDLNIDEAKGVLTITIPQEFLDKAVYPLTIDPTFGYETAGASDARFNNYVIGSLFTCPESGSAESITAYVRIDTANQQARTKTAIYKGSDKSLVKSSQEITLTSTSFSWVTYNLLAQADIINEDYWLVVWGETGTGYAFPYMAFDTGTATGGLQTVTYQAGEGDNLWPDPYNPTSTLTRTYSIYCTYTAAPAAGFKKLQYYSEPPSSGAWNKLKYASEPPVAGAWNKLLYEGE